MRAFKHDHTTLAASMIALAATAPGSSAAHAQAPATPPNPSIIVTGRQEDLTGVAASANQGTVSAADLP